MSQAYFGGRPTNIDIAKLDEKFGDIAEGEEVSYEQIAQVIGAPKGSHRFHTVVSAWRKHLLRQKNIDLGTVRGVGFKRLTPGDRVAAGVEGFQAGTRKQLRSVNRATRVVVHDPESIKKQMVLMRYGAAVAAQATEMRKEIEPPKAYSPSTPMRPIPQFETEGKALQ